jgi:hypothetical protein
MQTGTRRDAPDLKLEEYMPSHPFVRTTGQPDPVFERTYRRPRKDGRLSRQVKIRQAIRSVTTRFSAMWWLARGWKNVAAKKTGVDGE